MTTIEEVNPKIQGYIKALEELVSAMQQENDDQMEFFADGMAVFLRMVKKEGPDKFGTMMQELFPEHCNKFNLALEPKKRELELRTHLVRNMPYLTSILRDFTGDPIIERINTLDRLYYHYLENISKDRGYYDANKVSEYHQELSEIRKFLSEIYFMVES